MRDTGTVVPLPQSGIQASLQRQGFRLRRFEAFNWGTFHNRVWGLDLGGENTLLTGDIGSGKSTLVDAITTLVVPPQKINYNKAAGAEDRERTARTYVLGEFRKERGTEICPLGPCTCETLTVIQLYSGTFLMKSWDSQ